MRRRILTSQVGGILCLSLAFATGAVAAPVTQCVNPGGTGGCFSSIQDAVDAIPKTGQVNVASGDYAQFVSIASKKKIVIVGGTANALDTIIRAPASGTSVITSAKNSALTLQNVRIQEADVPANGGGINSLGALTLSNVLVQLNAANSGQGGGVFYGGPNGKLKIDKSVFIENFAQEGGGLFLANGGTITNSLIEFNVADIAGGVAFANGLLKSVNTAIIANSAESGDGGGLRQTGGKFQAINTTIDSNGAAGNGGGIAIVAGTANLKNSTVGNNAAKGSGGGVAPNGTAAAFAFNNTIIGNNAASVAGPDCASVVNSQGFNLIQSTIGCTIIGKQTGDITNADPLFAGIVCSGAALCVEEIDGASPAVDAGKPSPPTGKSTNCAPTDVFGTPRPTGACDIGAFEVP